MKLYGVGEMVVDKAGMNELDMHKTRWQVNVQGISSLGNYLASQMSFNNWRGSTDACLLTIIKWMVWIQLQSICSEWLIGRLWEQMQHSTVYSSYPVLNFALFPGSSPVFVAMQQKKNTLIGTQPNFMAFHIPPHPRSTSESHLSAW